MEIPKSEYNGHVPNSAVKSGTTPIIEINLKLPFKINANDKKIIATTTLKILSTVPTFFI